MSLTEPETQALSSIAGGLAGSDPRLASMLNIFSRLAAGEEMPAREKIRVWRGRPAAHHPRRAQRHPRRSTAIPQARRLYQRLGWQQAMLLLWMVISAGLLAVALVLNNSGHKTCTRSIGTACPSPASHSMPIPHLVNPRLLAEAFRHRQPAGCAIVQLDRQAHTIEIHAVRALTLAACGDHASALRTEAAARAPAAGPDP